MSPNQTAFVAAFTVELEALADEFRDQIDGSEETRGHDQRMTRYANTVSAAARLIRAYSDNEQKQTAIVNEYVARMDRLLRSEA